MDNILINVLYVDDEINNLNMFKATFRFTYNVFIANSPAEGVKILDENVIHVIITDQRMPEMTGVQFLKSILDKHPDPIRILLTGYSDINAVIDAVNQGQIYQYISKPWDENQIKLVIEKAFEVFSLRKENTELLQKLTQANQQLEFLLRQKLIS